MVPTFRLDYKITMDTAILQKNVADYLVGSASKNDKYSNARNYSVMWKILIGTNYALVVDYKTLRMPLLLVWGNRDTWVTPIERAKEIHREVKSSKLLILNGSHVILYQKPKIVIDNILKALPQNLANRENWLEFAAALTNK